MATDPYREAALSLVRHDYGWQRNDELIEAVAAALRQAALDASKAERERADKLQAFKDWTHRYLDNLGVPHHPPGTHGAAGCRIGDRMDWLMAKTRSDTRQAALDAEAAMREACAHEIEKYRGSFSELAASVIRSIPSLVPPRKDA